MTPKMLQRGHLLDGIIREKRIVCSLAEELDNDISVWRFNAPEPVGSPIAQRRPMRAMIHKTPRLQLGQNRVAKKKLLTCDTGFLQSASIGSWDAMPDELMKQAWNEPCPRVVFRQVFRAIR